MTLYPAVLTDSVREAQQQIGLASQLSAVEVVHVDVIDGQFADNVTITPADLPEIDFAQLECDIHLMTEEPLDFVYEIIEHKKHIPVRAVIGQVERMSHQFDFLETIKKYDWKAGLCLDLHTPLEAIDEDSWFQLDLVQLMGIEAGFQGRVFDQRVVAKIKELREISQEHSRNVEICIDGGVKPEIVPTLVDAGVDSYTAGSGLWKATNLVDQYQAYLERMA